MGKRRNASKRPIPLVPPKIKSLKRARHVTSEFHRLTHAIKAHEAQSAGDARAAGAAVAAATAAVSAMSKRARQQQKEKGGGASAPAHKHGGGGGAKCEGPLQSLRRELAALGGREAYQQASVVATSRQSSTKWVVKSLRRRGVLRRPGSAAAAGTATAPPHSARAGEPPRVLEVGAINCELFATKGLQVRSKYAATWRYVPFEDKSNRARSTKPASGRSVTLVDPPPVSRCARSTCLRASPAARRRTFSTSRRRRPCPSMTSFSPQWS